MPIVTLSQAFKMMERLEVALVLRGLRKTQHLRSSYSELTLPLIVTTGLPDSITRTAISK